ncbi:sodium voltage-gated channel beta subunit 2 [Phyllostomus discolor]|uniref:Sodium channel regulatory subunit beta-4 n=1 Tax=Phyllostomus discolor TaxID=89673 RepID=A0A834E729_9CHIR|nr:sodium voltage-gated channel beta subunit 2 [Phyllostomus discolor]
MHKDAWLPRPAFSLTGLSLFLSLVPPGRNMEVTVPTTLNVLNGSDARLACTFNSCYTVNHKQFSLNWTYQECSNCSEEMFLQFRMKIINLKLERFRDRVEFSGNPGKYDVSVTLKNVRIEDEGLYNCYIMNPPDRHRGHGRIHLQVLMEGLFLLPVSLSLEVSVGKATDLYAVNGTEILLPCTFSSCFGFHDLGFWWSYNSSDTFKILISGTVKTEKADPKVHLKIDDRISLEGSTKEKMNNLSILLKDLDFSDTGKYTCHVKNPKEKDLQHQATVFLHVVDKLEEVDNTVTLIILAVVGGVIGLLIFILLVKKLITFILKKTQEQKKECLVSSSGNDNTENGLPGSKAEEKPPTKV